MSDFTQGPWFVGEDDSNDQAVVRGEHIEVATCWHHCVGSIEREMRCNALLIASAPELLAALRETWRVLRAAGTLNLSNGVQLGQTSWYVKICDAEALSDAAIAKAAPSPAAKDQASQGVPVGAEA